MLPDNNLEIDLSTEVQNMKITHSDLLNRPKTMASTNISNSSCEGCEGEFSPLTENPREISVPDYECISDVTYYNIYFDGIYNCSQRFNCFFTLRLDLEKLFPSAQLPILPPKLYRSSTLKINDRKQGLEFFLNEILKNEELWNCNLVKEFLSNNTNVISDNIGKKLITVNFLFGKQAFGLRKYENAWVLTKRVMRAIQMQYQNLNHVVLKQKTGNNIYRPIFPTEFPHFLSGPISLQKMTFSYFSELSCLGSDPSFRKLAAYQFYLSIKQDKFKNELNESQMKDIKNALQREEYIDIMKIGFKLPSFNIEFFPDNSQTIYPDAIVAVGIDGVKFVNRETGECLRTISLQNILSWSCLATGDSQLQSIFRFVWVDPFVDSKTKITSEIYSPRATAIRLYLHRCANETLENKELKKRRHVIGRTILGSPSSSGESLNGSSNSINKLSSEKINKRYSVGAFSNGSKSAVQRLSKEGINKRYSAGTFSSGNSNPSLKGMTPYKDHDGYGEENEDDALINQPAYFRNSTDFLNCMADLSIMDSPPTQRHSNAAAYRSNESIFNDESLNL